MDKNALKILAVDDETLNLEIIAHILEKNGYQVECVNNGGQALTLLSANPDYFDLVLLDRMMPVMDGMEVLERMKDNEKLQNIPIIMQTAASNKEQIEEGIRAGVYYYLTKPYKQKALLQIVNSAANSLCKKTKTANIKITPQENEQQFTIRSLDEANDTTVQIANFFPNPDQFLMPIRNLLTNAIEHGLLRINKQKKQILVQKREWEQEVLQRLSSDELKDKKVIALVKRNDESITLKVIDDGRGFDWETLTGNNGRDELPESFRHLEINKTPFSEVRYRGLGNEVEATLLLTKQQQISGEHNASSEERTPENESGAGAATQPLNTPTAPEPSPRKVMISTPLGDIETFHDSESW